MGIAWEDMLTLFVAFVGITDYMQQNISDIMFVDFPLKVGDTIAAFDVGGSNRIWTSTLNNSDESSVAGSGH